MSRLSNKGHGAAGAEDAPRLMPRPLACSQAKLTELAMITDRVNIEGRRTLLNVMQRITVDPEQCGGRPCIRGMRIRVIDVLDLFAAGLSAEQVLEEMPDLEMEDLKAVLTYAARRLDHPVLVA
jgi:uncharacterized protein (DUF433 family)